VTRHPQNNIKGAAIRNLPLLVRTLSTLQEAFITPVWHHRRPSAIKQIESLPLEGTSFGPCLMIRIIFLMNLAICSPQYYTDSYQVYKNGPSGPSEMMWRFVLPILSILQEASNVSICSSNGHGCGSYRLKCHTISRSGEGRTLRHI
jgi:hypothetical protein